MRIDVVDSSGSQPAGPIKDVREALEEQTRLWGEPLYPYLFYARHPAYFRAASAMWAALQEQATRVPWTLRAMVNRRVAWWNGCEYCQDAHAAKGSKLGLSAQKIDALRIPSQGFWKR
jgi:AhpD family alkylhydroperoxidase